MEKDFISVNPDKGSGEEDVTLNVSKNTGREARSTSISIVTEEEGVLKTIPIDQDSSSIKIIVVGNKGLILNASIQ